MGETFEVAAKNMRRLRRIWPRAVFRDIGVARQLAVPFAHEPDMGQSGDGLLKLAESPCHDLHTRAGLDQSLLPFPFRAPSKSMTYRRVHEVRAFTICGFVAVNWGTSISRADQQFDLSRWVLPLPTWWDTLDLRIEPEYSVSHIAHDFLDVSNAAWSCVF